MLDFDEVIERRGTYARKWDGLGRVVKDPPEGTIPMWVADMDFAAPPAVSEAIENMLSHRVLGYFGDTSDYFEASCNWMRTRQGFDADPDWITITPGTVAGVGYSVQAFSEPGDGVVIFSPVYQAFKKVILAANRKPIESELRQVQGQYQMDLAALETMVDARTKVVVLCSPHNPGGTVWSKDELAKLCEFCLKRDIVLVSDEIHNDLVYSESTHCPTGNAHPDIADRLVSLMSCTKTFNLAAALTGNAIISDPEMRAKFRQAMSACGNTDMNGFGVTAATAAFRHGHEWLDALVPYLQANRDRFDEAVARYMPGVRSMKLQATYLSWLDFSETGMTLDELLTLVQREARIAAYDGNLFGVGGDLWMRFNIACPRPVLDQAIENLAAVFAKR